MILLKEQSGLNQTEVVNQLIEIVSDGVSAEFYKDETKKGGQCVIYADEAFRGVSEMRIDYEKNNYDWNMFGIHMASIRLP